MYYAKASQDCSIKRVSDVRQLLKLYRTVFGIKAPSQNTKKSIWSFDLVVVILIAGAGENYENTMTAFQRYVIFSLMLLNYRTNTLQCATFPELVHTRAIIKFCTTVACMIC